MQTNRRYWIIGGEYEDTRFENMRRGSHDVIGPFEDDMLSFPLPKQGETS